MRVLPWLAFSSILPPVRQLTLRPRCDLPTTLRQLKTNADRADNGEQRLGAAEFVIPKTAVGAETGGGTLDTPPSKWTALHMIRCKLLRGKVHQSFFLP